jgi:hypothetical protein
VAFAFKLFDGFCGGAMIYILGCWSFILIGLIGHWISIKYFKYSRIPNTGFCSNLNDPKKCKIFTSKYSNSQTNLFDNETLQLKIHHISYSRCLAEGQHHTSNLIATKKWIMFSTYRKKHHTFSTAN